MAAEGVSVHGEADCLSRLIDQHGIDSPAAVLDAGAEPAVSPSNWPLVVIA